MSETAGKIYQQIPKIMAEVGPIAKTKSAPQYKFRGIDDVYAALQLVMAKHGVFPVPVVKEERSEERTTKSGTLMIYRILKMDYHLFADDGSFVTATVIGEGVDQSDKASNKAMSVAQKYALLQIFCIPTEGAKDPEEDHHELAEKRKTDHDDAGFDPKNKDHVRWLTKILIDRRIEAGLYDKITKALTGKPASEFEETLAFVLKTAP